MKTAFGAEFHLAGRVDRIRKYDMPVRVFADGAPRRPQGATGEGRRRHRPPRRSISTSRWPTSARTPTSWCTLVRDRDLNRTIATFYGSERAREIKASLDPQCLSGFRKNEHFAIEHSDVILTVDAGDFVFLDCAYEELLQSLGPINDTDSVPWTMFNDKVSMGYLRRLRPVPPQHALRSRASRPGMTVEEVKAVLPEVLADVRAYVKQINNLPE